MGWNSADALTSGSSNIIFGHDTGRCITTANYSVLIGHLAGHRNDDGGYHVFLGYGAGRCMQGDSNIAIGREAGRGGSTPSSNSGTDNIAIGMYAGCELTSGSQNILIGRNAGDNITSGGKNVVIGYSIDPASSTGTGQFIIGCNGNHWICGDSSMNIYDKDGNQLNGGGGSGGTVSSGSFTAVAGTASTIETYAYDAAELVFEYTVFVKNGSNYQSQKVLVMRDSTTVHSTQYGVMYSGDLLVSLDATITGSNLLLKATPETGVSGSTTFRVKREVT